MRTESEKWQHMLNFVNQHTQRFPSNIDRTNPAKKFRRLVMLRFLADNLLVFMLQYVGLNLSQLIVHPSPLWLATGTTCAYLFLKGYGVLPGIWLGCFLGFYLQKIGFVLALDYATGLTLQGVMLLWFSHRYLSPTLIFYRLSAFIKFLVYAFLLTGMVSFIFICIGYYSSLSHADMSLYRWLQWWLANFNAILVFSCALITWDAYFPDFYAVKLLKSTFFLFGLLLFFIMSLIFSHTPTLTTCLALLIMLLTAMISAYLGWCGAVTAVFLCGMVVCFAGFLDAPVFYTYSVAVSLLLLQGVVCVNAMIGLSIASSRSNKRVRLPQHKD